MTKPTKPKLQLVASGSGAANIKWDDSRANRTPPSPANILMWLKDQRISLRTNDFSDTAEYQQDGSAWKSHSDKWLELSWTRAARAGLAVPYDYWVRFLGGMAQETLFNPVLDYLNGLVWDGVPRINKWLTTYAGAVDTAYVRAVGTAVLVAGVRRVRDPGAKFDSCLVLEGPQGAGKSSLLSILGSQWFTDNLAIGADSKIVIEQTRGRWIVELPELSGLGKRDVEEVKAFLSRQVDEARLAFGRLATSKPRQFICIATVNPGATGEYLIDSTGNRRFWPIVVKTIDLVRLKLDRDQLWAEAAHAESEGAPVHLTGELEQAAVEQQGERVVTDPWQDQIEQQLVGWRGHVATTKLWSLLGTEASRQDKYTAARLANVMQLLGFKAVQRKFKTRNTRGFSNDHDGDWLE